MTFNLLFFTVSITKRVISIEEIEHQERVNKMYEQMKLQQFKDYRKY